MSRPLAPLLLAACAALFALSAPARAQQDASPPEDCPAQYERAESRYFDADFDRAVALAEACLRRGDLAQDLRVRFLRLLVLAHLERGATGEARQAATGLLGVRPAYTPDPVSDPPAYAQFIREVKAEQRGEPQEDARSEGRRWVKWALAGAGTIATGVLAAVLLGGGDDGGSDGGALPRPPTP